MSVDFKADFSARKTIPKKAAERKNSNKIQVTEDTRNEENMTIIVIDQNLQIELFLLVFITCNHEMFLSLFFLLKIKLNYIQAYVRYTNVKLYVNFDF